MLPANVAVPHERQRNPALQLCRGSNITNRPGQMGHRPAGDTVCTSRTLSAHIIRRLECVNEQMTDGIRPSLVSRRKPYQCPYQNPKGLRGKMTPTQMSSSRVSSSKPTPRNKRFSSKYSHYQGWNRRQRCDTWIHADRMAAHGES